MLTATSPRSTAPHIACRPDTTPTATPTTSPPAPPPPPFAQSPAHQNSVPRSHTPPSPSPAENALSHTSTKIAAPAAIDPEQLESKRHQQRIQWRQPRRGPRRPIEWIRISLPLDQRARNPPHLPAVRKVVHQRLKPVRAPDQNPRHAHRKPHPEDHPGGVEAQAAIRTFWHGHAARFILWTALTHFQISRQNN